ncbi:MAG TPA: galactose oxidase early set domain-containing protein [Verrucomicrobiae bacterium]|nr:galactose oxidase early set domain-containing protein [Verrucomicrobiae bacterium]
MKPIPFFHPITFSFSRMLCAAAVLALAGAAANVHVAGAPYNTDPNMPYADVDLSVRPGGTVTWLAHTNTDPRLHGKVGPLLPSHAMAVHNTLVWKTNEDTPKMLMFHRHSGYTADELANPDVINFIIQNPNPGGPGAGGGDTALSNPGNQFNSALRRSFNQLCYGGYTIIHDVSQSVPQRIRVDQYLDLCQLYDWGHPDAYKYDTADPKYVTAALNNHDAELNFGATKNMGVSRGLYYDMYCPGFCTLEDGRPIFPGGHDMNSQNGNYRIQIYDPDNEIWVQRPMSCMRAQYNADPEDPYSELFFWSRITNGLSERSIYFPIGNSISNDCNPHLLTSITGVDYSTNYPAIRLMNPERGTVTHPDPVPSDMRYARWYPGCVALPGNKAFIFGGWDRDEIAIPTGTAPNSSSTWLTNFFASETWSNSLPWNFKLAGFLSSAAGTPANQVTQPVPEVYDGNTDTTIALENARLLHPAWYPNSCVVQTGTNAHDWKVLVNSGILFEDAAEAGGELGSASSEQAARHTYLVDVQGAMADSDRETPNVREGKWLKYVDTATNIFAPFSANADMMELDTNGMVLSHRLYHIGGRNTSSAVTASSMYLEMASLSKPRLPGEPPIPMPKWTTIPGSLVVRARQNYATPMPDGKICIIGGNGTGNSGMEAWSMHVQILDPATGLISTMDKSQVPRDEHGIIHLWPDGRVYMGGQNRNGLTPAGNPFAPAGDSDLGVASAQFFTPPYLFDANTNEAVRPVITAYPSQIDYGINFDVTVDNAESIGSVCIIRTGSMSHSLCTDRRYIKLPFTRTGGNVLRVTAPKLPGTAIGGYYMLFVVNENGTPCHAKKVVVGSAVASRD